jgi:hypothetical protein
VQWNPEGASAGAQGQPPDFARLTEMCRRLADGEDARLPEDAEAFVARHPWFA